MTPSTPVVVFADLNQSSIDHNHPRSSDVSTDEVLARERVMFVLSSSMTRAELESSQQQLGIRQPFICESGAAVLIPHGYFPFRVPYDRDLSGYHVIEFGRPYDEVVAALRSASARVRVPVVSFRDLSVDEVAVECRLSLAKARLAKLREYDEPFRLVNPDRDAHDRLWKALRADRWCCTHHGVHEHVGASVDKGRCVGVLIGLYRRAFGTLLAVGVGSASYRALLRRVTRRFVPDSSGDTASVDAMWQMPSLRATASRSAWEETVVDVARRARAASVAR